MGKMKFYAIKTPALQKIVTSWTECEALTHGVKACQFKSFPTRESAEEWLSGISKVHADGLRIYVDGSFSPDFDRAGWAFIAVEDGKEIATESGVTDLPAESRNIDGELTASLHAMAWLKRMGKTGVICHDYEGIARWAKGDWKANKPISKRYVLEARKYPGMKFEKVPAHSGVKWNEAVDERAKVAIVRAKKELAIAKQNLSALPPLEIEKPEKKSATKIAAEGTQLDLFG